MNTELRELIGIVAYQAIIKDNGPGVDWDELSEQAKERYRRVGEAVAAELATAALPALQILVFAFTGRHIETHLK